MTRQIVALISILLLANGLNAQTDLKFDPLPLVFAKNIKGGLEVGINKDIGLDLDVLYSNAVNIPLIGSVIDANAFGLRFLSKFYFKPKYSTDRFYIGPYFKYRRTSGQGYIHQRIAIGGATGYKFFIFDNCYIEFGFGLGARVFSSIKSPLGETFAEELITQSLWDIVTNNFGRADFTSRFLIGYRISGYGPKSILKQEEQKP